MQALYTQLSFELKRFSTQKKQIKTLFIGGGTPSTVDPELYKPIFELLNPYLQDDAEITTEANPNSATKEWLKGMQSLGVNRISFGVQSFNENKLKALNRAHTPQQAQKAILYAKEIGFKHLSLDLIYNYQGDTQELLLNDIEEAFSLPIDHISAYELTIEDGTKFSTTPEVRQENEDLAFFVADEIKKRGFTHYEISNFGSYQSRHNKGYWELEDYIGALKDTRYYPQTNIELYISDPLNITEEALSQDELLTEKIFLGLRSSIGIQKSLLSEKMIVKAQILCEENKLRCDSTHYYNDNFFLSDELALYILG
jgi:oxygen-independent coproporphyrinogen-3 oxidase